MIRAWTLSILLGVSALLTAPAHASLTFQFSFDNTLGNVAGTVSGRIVGLQDNLANQQATNIFIDSMPAGLGGPATPVDMLTLNNTAGDFVQSFSVFGGQITAVGVALQGNFPPQTTPDAGTFVGFFLNSGYLNQTTTYNNAVTFNNGASVLGNDGGLAGTTYTAAAVPLPASGLLVLAGLGALALTRRSRG